MSDQQFQELMQILGNIGQLAFAAAMRQVQLDGRATAVFGLIMFLLLCVALVVAKKFMDGSVEEHRRDLVAARIDPLIDSPFHWEGYAFMYAVFGMVSLLMLSIAYRGITMLINPQWAALRYLASLAHR